MKEYLDFIVSYEMLPYTFLLGGVIFYWLTVIIGVVDIDFIDFDIPDSGVEDAIEGGIESVGTQVSAFSSLLNFIHLGKVPITIIGSFLILKMWFFAYLFNDMLIPQLGGLSVLILIALHLGFAFLNACFCTFLTGITTFPFCSIFEHKTERGGSDILGLDCKVRSLKVDAKTGQAEVETANHAFLTISVRAKDGEFKKGDVARIDSYDDQNNIYYITY